MADINELLNKQRDERGADKWEPEAGDVIEGIITKTGWYDGGEYTPSLWLMVKNIETEDSVRVYCPTVLRNQVNEEAPAMGSGVAIRYEGRQLSEKSGRKYHDYTLALVPDKDGNVKRDNVYWREHGVYRGAASNATDSGGDSADKSDDGWF